MRRLRQTEDGNELRAITVAETARQLALQFPNDPAAEKLQIPLIPVSTTSAATPSMSSLRGGGLRAAEASSIISGATVRIPSASDANQCCQVDKMDAVELWKYKNPAVPPIPETAAATIAAARIPSTWLSRSRLNPKPKYFSISHPASSASPALHRAKTIAPMKVRSPNRLATMVATAAPAATGKRARGPTAIRTPAATPDAGQNTATPSGLVSRRRLSRAARK